MFKNIRILTIVLLITVCWGCEDLLDAPPFDEFAPENVLVNQEGIEALLFNAYHIANRHQSLHTWTLPMESSTDIMVVSEGGVAGLNSPFATFTWTADTQWLNEWWSRLYQVIRDANVVIENIGNFESFWPKPGSSGHPLMPTYTTCSAPWYYAPVPRSLLTKPGSRRKRCEPL